MTDPLSSLPAKIITFIIVSWVIGVFIHLSYNEPEGFYFVSTMWGAVVATGFALADSFRR